MDARFGDHMLLHRPQYMAGFEILANLEKTGSKSLTACTNSRQLKAFANRLARDAQLRRLHRIYGLGRLKERMHRYFDGAKGNGDLRDLRPSNHHKTGLAKPL